MVKSENTCAPASTSAPAEPTDAMVDAYLKANDAYWKRTDELPTPPNKWRTGSPREATRESLRAVFALAGAPDAAPVGEPAARVIEIDYESRKVLVRFAEAIPEWLEIGPIALATPTGVAADESTSAAAGGQP